jgi:hypothetical protein
MYWLGRQARLNQWTAHAPAILLICSSYLLNIIYRTGAWAELVAVSAIPLLMASAISLLRSDRLRLWPAVALTTSTVLFTGSHNITLLWGTTMLAVVGGTLVACLPTVRRAITYEGVLRVAAVLIPAVLVNAWFLLPNLAYQSMTVMAGDDVDIGLKWGAPMAAAKYVFSLGRASSPERFYVLALPVVAVAWVVAGLFVTRSARRTPWFRAVLVLLGITTVLTVLMTRTDLISSLPRPWPFIQFGFRLQIYILLCLCVATIGVLRLAGTTPPGRARTLWRWAAVPVLVLMIVQAVGQTRADPPLSERTGDRREVRTYLTEVPHPSEAQYTSRRLPVMEQLNALANFPVEAEDGDRAVIVLNVAPGALLLSNFMLMPPLVAVTGAKIVGRHGTFRTVLQVPVNAPPGPTTITIEAARPWPVVVGRILSVVGLLGLLANGLWIALARRRRRGGVPT